jgi:hypothetical protein
MLPHRIWRGNAHTSNQVLEEHLLGRSRILKQKENPSPSLSVRSGGGGGCGASATFLC